MTHHTINRDEILAARHWHTVASSLDTGFSKHLDAVAGKDLWRVRRNGEVVYEGNAYDAIAIYNRVGPETT